MNLLVSMLLQGIACLLICVAPVYAQTSTPIQPNDFFIDIPGEKIPLGTQDFEQALRTFACWCKNLAPQTEYRGIHLAQALNLGGEEKSYAFSTSGKNLGKDYGTPDDDNPMDHGFIYCRKRDNTFFVKGDMAFYSFDFLSLEKACDAEIDHTFIDPELKNRSEPEYSELFLARYSVLCKSHHYYFHKLIRASSAERAKELAQRYLSWKHPTTCETKLEIFGGYGQ